MHASTASAIQLVPAQNRWNTSILLIYCLTCRYIDTCATLHAQTTSLHTSCTIVQWASNHRGSQFRFLCAWQAVSAIWGRFLSSEGALRHIAGCTPCRVTDLQCQIMSDYISLHFSQIMSDARPGHASRGTNRGSTVQEMENLGNKSSGRFLTLLKTSWSHDFISWSYNTISLRPDLCSDRRTPF